MNDPKIYYRRHLPHYQPQGATYHVTFRLKGSLPREIIEGLRAEREQAERKLAKATNGREQETRRLLLEYRWAYFERFDALLDGSSSGLTWLKQPEIAALIQEALFYQDAREYHLLAYCIMPNHVHVVFSLLPPEQRVGRVPKPIVSRVTRPDGEESSDEAGTNMDGTGVPSYIVSDIFGSVKKFTARRANSMLGRRGSFGQDESYDHVIRDDNELERTIWYVLDNPVKAGLVQSWELWPWTYVKPGIL